MSLSDLSINQALYIILSMRNLLCDVTNYV